MPKVRYDVLFNDTVLAENMTLTDALMFIEALAKKDYLDLDCGAELGLKQHELHLYDN